MTSVAAEVIVDSITMKKAGYSFHAGVPGGFFIMRYTIHVFKDSEQALNDSEQIS